MSALGDHYTTFGRRNRRHRRPINRLSLLSFAFPRLKPNTRYGYVTQAQERAENGTFGSTSQENQSKHFPHSHLRYEAATEERGKWKYFGRNKISALPFLSGCSSQKCQTVGRKLRFTTIISTPGYENFFRGEGEVHPGISNNLGKRELDARKGRQVLPPPVHTNSLPLFRYDDFVTAKGCEAPFSLNCYRPNDRRDKAFISSSFRNKDKQMPSRSLQGSGLSAKPTRKSCQIV